MNGLWASQEIATQRRQELADQVKALRGRKDPEEVDVGTDDEDSQSAST